MGEVIRFIPKSERERIRLIRRARAIYDSIFPPVDPIGEQRGKPSAGHTVTGVTTSRSDGGLVS
jgi:hypothetical protein